jgi:chemotaxis protein methyltransferase CheR
MDDLVAEITVGETYFFREPRQMEVIKREIIPDLRSHRTPGHRLRIWSAGCASGEEAYTLAIIAREFGLEPPADIVATDLSRQALARAARARYARWSLRGVAQEVIRTNFKRHGDWFDLEPEVHRAVEFGYLNLAEDCYPSLASGICGMDLILCRNVLIYFDRETAAQVARRLVDSLAEGGWLVLGASDPAVADMAPCEVVVTSAGLAYRRGPRQEAPLRAVAELPMLPPMIDSAPTPSLPRQTTFDAPQGRSTPTQAAESAVDAEQLVRSLANQGSLEAAGRACATALKRHPQSAVLIYLHAVLLAEAGQHIEAAKAIRGALYLDHDLAVAHMALGSWLARIGEWKGARRSMRNAVRLLESMAPDAVVPASDGELAGRLAGMVRTRLALLAEDAA